MAVGEWFQTFCGNLRIGTDKRSSIANRPGRIAGQLNADLRGLDSKTSYRFYVGLRTNNKAYAAAQKALKEAEELFFTDEELNKMLPKQLRSTVGAKP